MRDRRTIAHAIIPAGHELLRKIAEVMMLAGATTTELQTAFQEAASAAGLRRRQATSKEAPFTWWTYGRVLSAWHQRSEFTDEEGRALSIPIHRGLVSFQTLAKSEVPDANPREVLRALKSLGAVRIIRGNRVIATTRSLIEKHRTQMALVRAIEVMNALITTIHSNVVKSRSKTQGRGLFERWVVNEKFDIRHLRALDALVRTHGQSFLELLDEWLARHEIRSANDSRHASYVGVEICIFSKAKAPKRKPAMTLA